MAKFNYKMQSILNIKIKLESQAKTAYSQANAALMKEQRKLQEILVRKAGYEQRAKELVSGTIHVVDIRENKRAIDTIKTMMRQQMLAVQVAEKNVEAARKRLNDVMIERKTHEKLRENAFEQFKQELEHEESKAVDELVSYTYHKKEEQ